MKKGQLTLGLKHRGGKRKGAGRKPKGARAGVSHRSRPAMTAKTPAHVTLKVRQDLPNLRSSRIFPIIQMAIIYSCEKENFRLVEFSVQHDHVHLIAEADDSDALARGIQGLCVRIARGVNRFLKRKGKVFKDRFHSRVLGTPKEVYLCLKYVLLNARKHFAQVGRRVARGWIDPLSSGICFSGWAGKQKVRERVLPVGRSWLVLAGWRKYGLIDLSERAC